MYLHAMNFQDINYVVFDDERFFPEGQEPGTVTYCRTPKEFLDYVNTGAEIDVLVLDHDLGIDHEEGKLLDVREAIQHYVARIECGDIEGPNCVLAVTGSPSGGAWLMSMFRYICTTVSDPFGRDTGLLG